MSISFDNMDLLRIVEAIPPGEDDDDDGIEDDTMSNAGSEISISG
jgi:hypothetical protein